MIAISFKNLRKVFVKSGKQFDALCDVSFDVKEGEFFGLLGPNGAGKTSLINILGGISNPTFGTVEVFGLDVTEVPERTKRLLGIVPQELVFDPFFTVKETLKIQSGLFGIRDNNLWIEECLVELGLTEQANANMRALSGGMKRRVLIAQALVHKPPIIVLDEPTAGVDIDLRESLWLFIKKLNKLGHTIILTTHYLEEAEMLCERAAFMFKGKLSSVEDISLLSKSDGGIKEVFKNMSVR
ncbi:MAG: ABC transporter ATP-binding protein [Betaproteobacteria bacterium TMED82]|nr:MAG: ABC transporter ATP-binding protein [Betaproteobacteria bacterium TMED82]|tara:strand:- start:4485 stop:5207 length:723 start_codon:yes stop_codon:yes gene_type:complete